MLLLCEWEWHRTLQSAVTRERVSLCSELELELGLGLGLGLLVRSHRDRVLARRWRPGGPTYIEYALTGLEPPVQWQWKAMILPPVCT